MEDDDDGDDDEAAGLVFVHLRFHNTDRSGAAGGNEVDSHDKCYKNRLSGGDQSGRTDFVGLSETCDETSKFVLCVLCLSKNVGNHLVIC